MHRTLILLLALGVNFMSAGQAAAVSSPAQALSIGQTWTVDSAVLGEKRRINVYLPAGIAADKPMPVLYMPDGGLREDFLHVAGLLQVGAGNGSTRAFLLVGIENTERRRDLTGPTENAKDRTIAPRVGGAQAFRQFIRTELMPEVAKRYRITAEKAIVGESLAGLFVIETLMTEPDLFDTYIAIDPSLWWNDGALTKSLGDASLAFKGNKSLYIATSADAQGSVDGADLRAKFSRLPGLSFHFQHWPDETHATIFHPAALTVFRGALKP